KRRSCGAHSAAPTGSTRPTRRVWSPGFGDRRAEVDRTGVVRTVVVLFNRDLRVHDHPALAQAAREAERVVPLFVLDEGILGGGFAAPNRLAFLLDSLADLDSSLRKLGARPVVRRGDAV